LRFPKDIIEYDALVNSILEEVTIPSIIPENSWRIRYFDRISVTSKSISCNEDLQAAILANSQFGKSNIELFVDFERIDEEPMLVIMNDPKARSKTFQLGEQ
jgi:hypothetical protein